MSNPTKAGTVSRPARSTVELIQQLKKIAGDRSVVVDETELLVYECDALTLFKNKPDVVVFATTTEQVAAIVRLAWPAPTEGAAP